MLCNIWYSQIRVHDEDGYVINWKSLMDDSKSPYEALHTFPKPIQNVFSIPNNPVFIEIINKMRFFYFHNGRNKNDFIKWWKLSPTADMMKSYCLVLG